MAVAATSALTVEIDVPRPSTGASTTPDGRVFLVHPQLGGPVGPQVVEVLGTEFRAYPSEEWNGWTEGQDPAQHLVCVNSQRIGPDGSLWLLDVGSAGLGNPIIDGAPKLVRIDLSTDTVSRIYPLADALRTHSYADDVRFNGRLAYITDAGEPGLVIVDLDSGDVRRVLDRHWSTTAQRAITADGVELRYGTGETVFIHNDQLEVSPDGRFLYFQPCCGPMARVETRLLDDPDIAGAELEAGVEYFASTGSTGGTAIAADGTIYITNTDARRLSAVTPDGRLRTLIEDPRLSWVDAMWLDGGGRLWLPAAQLNLAAAFQGGVDKVVQPLQVLSVQVGGKPPENDHA